MALLEILRHKFKIELEMSCGCCALAMTGAGDTPESMISFAQALLMIDRDSEGSETKQNVSMITEIPKRNCCVSDALRFEKTLMNTKDAEGRTSAEYVWAYPPGVPLLIPGEEISGQFIAFAESSLKSCTVLKSTSGNSAKSIYVVD